MKPRVREGDLVETRDAVLFDVKGLVHPPKRVVAFPRYVPDSQGSRERDGTRYRKIYALSERYALLKRRYPHYLVSDPIFDEHLCEVPVEDVQHHHQPVRGLQQLRQKDELNPLESQALEFAQLLRRNARIPWIKLGISGSVLVGLHTKDSDIDPLIYGSDACRSVYSLLKSLADDATSQVRRYNQRELSKLFAFRSRGTATSLEDFIRTESRKVMQGKFQGRDYFLRLVKDWNEVRGEYGDITYRNLGRARIRASIMDDSEALFTPCHYAVDNVEALRGEHRAAISEIVSFRGRFCEQAREEETVVAEGKVESVTSRDEASSLRLLIGSSPSDFMILESRTI